MSDPSLCSTCAHAPECSLIKKGVAVVLNCEEFEPGEGTPEEADGGRSPSPDEAGSTRASDGGNFLGLCANCAKRETCTFPKPEGGVWHCEEYQVE